MDRCLGLHCTALPSLSGPEFLLVATRGTWLDGVDRPCGVCGRPWRIGCLVSCLFDWRGPDVLLPESAY